MNKFEHIKFKAELQKYAGIACCSPLCIKLGDWALTNFKNTDNFLIGWTLSVFFFIMGLIILSQSISIMEERDYVIHIRTNRKNNRDF